jgi:hypothetical protein
LVDQGTSHDVYGITYKATRADCGQAKAAARRLAESRPHLPHPPPPPARFALRAAALAVTFPASFFSITRWPASTRAGPDATEPG